MIGTGKGFEMGKGETPRIIKARKRGLLRIWVRRMIEGRTRAGVRAIRAQGIERLRERLREEPGGTLFAANHSCWWDFFLAHMLNESIPVDGYGMTEHSNMLKYGFFRRIGAYSVDRSSPAAVREAIAYTAELLRSPNSGVWIFPQGRIVCNDVRPLEFQGGLRAIARRAGRTRIVPTALRYEFWQDERPEALARFGEPMVVEGSETDRVLETVRERLTAELDALRADALTQDASRFTTLLDGKESIHERYARIRGRLGLGPKRGGGSGEGWAGGA